MKKISYCHLEYLLVELLDERGETTNTIMLKCLVNRPTHLEIEAALSPFKRDTVVISPISLIEKELLSQGCHPLEIIPLNADRRIK